MQSSLGAFEEVPLHIISKIIDMSENQLASSRACTIFEMASGITVDSVADDIANSMWYQQFPTPTRFCIIEAMAGKSGSPVAGLDLIKKLHEKVFNIFSEDTIMSKRVKKNVSIVQAAVISGNLEALKWAFALVPRRDGSIFCRIRYWCPLVESIVYRQGAVLDLLIQLGARVDDPCHNLIFYALTESPAPIGPSTTEQLVAKLIQAGAKVSAEDVRYARIHMSPEVFKMLIDASHNN
jgi:hypothetical protein